MLTWTLMWTLQKFHQSIFIFSTLLYFKIATQLLDKYIIYTGIHRYWFMNLYVIIIVTIIIMDNRKIVSSLYFKPWVKCYYLFLSWLKRDFNQVILFWFKKSIKKMYHFPNYKLILWARLSISSVVKIFDKKTLIGSLAFVL